MTLSQHDKDQIHRAILRRVGPLDEQFRSIVETKRVTLDQEKWHGILEYFSTDVAREVLYGPSVPEEKRGERHPFYKEFEMLSRFTMSEESRSPLIQTLIWVMLDLGWAEKKSLERYLNLQWEDKPALEEGTG